MTQIVGTGSGKVQQRQRGLRWTWICAALCCLLAMQNPAAAHAQRKKRIAVLPFETGSDAKQTAQLLGVRDDLGLSLSNLLVNEIAGAGKVEIVERSALDKILAEQNLSNSDRWDNKTAARIGKIAGVDAVLIGSTAQFSGSSKETQGSKLWALAGKTPLSNSQARRMQTKVTIVLTGRLIDVNTGVLLASGQGSGESENTELKVNSGATNQQSGSPVLNDATLKAVKTLAAQLDSSPALSETVAVARTPYSTTVADVEGNTLILALGTSGGTRVGDVVQISRTGRTIKDKTGAVLKVLYEPLGTAKITEVDSKTATATFTGTGTKAPKVDDVASFAP